MIWYSKTPPLYVWERDRWYNERNNLTYDCDIKKGIWFLENDTITFPPKTKIMQERQLCQIG